MGKVSKSSVRKERNISAVNLLSFPPDGTRTDGQCCLRTLLSLSGLYPRLRNFFCILGVSVSNSFGT